MPELWETSDLMEVTYSDGAAPPDGFWLRYYDRVFTSQAQEIFFDQMMPRDRRLAPFVAPNVQGRVMKSRGQTLASFKPAYVKPKHVVDPTKALTRRANEPLGGINAGSLSLQQRFDAVVADNLRSENEMIQRRIDWMACQATVYGQVLVAGEDYPAVTVDFARHSSLTTVLTGAATWDGISGDGLHDIGVQRKNAFVRGRAPVNTLIFGPDAWTAFAGQAKVLDLLNKMKDGSGSQFNRTGLTDGSPMEYMGQISGPDGAGRMDLWTYSNDYEDEDEAGNVTSIPYMDPRDVVGVGGAIGGVQAYGAIMDFKAGLSPLKLFPKNWVAEDPSIAYTMTQCAPLMVPTNPNNTFRIRALA